MSVNSQSGRTTPAERSRVTRRVTVVGAVVNLVLSVVKIVIGVVGQSQAMVADGIHSLSDLLSDGLVYYAAHHSHQEPDEQHPYGHGRFETAATLGLAFLLILVAVGLIWDAASRLFAPESLLVPEPIALYAAVLSILSKEALYHYTRVAADRIGSDMLRANAWHHRSDAISSVVVLVGVAGTMAGLPYLDAIAAALVGLMVAKIGWDLGHGSVLELVDTSLDAKRIEEIRGTILAVGGVRDIHMLRTRKLGGHAAADVHVLVEPRLSVSEGHMISLMVEQSLKREIYELEDVTVHIDPEDDESAPPCLGLPMRKEALALLEKCWSEIPEAGSRTGLSLHYLNGRIDPDIYLPLVLYRDEEQTTVLRTGLQEPLNSLKEFGTVKVFYQ